MNSSINKSLVSCPFSIQININGKESIYDFDPLPENVRFIRAIGEGIICDTETGIEYKGRLQEISNG